jgi:hypothetical protein
MAPSINRSWSFCGGAVETVARLDAYSDRGIGRYVDTGQAERGGGSATELFDS